MSARLLSYKDLSERWQLSVNTLRVWKMKRKLKPIKLGRSVRFTLAYIEELEKRGLVKC
ncbi:MAG: hypothetical protein A4E57_03508 [Syntrophorhabdaceae bacterium PtaU1.Bin034]|jgi:hypothetical protein|nr:MAG: hypothetical protein A4E57_03508 [Syntrophorhabdaceae bacterium PtaU1.Bin034]